MTRVEGEEARERERAIASGKYESLLVITFASRATFEWNTSDLSTLLTRYRCERESERGRCSFKGEKKGSARWQSCRVKENMPRPPI